MGTPHRGSGSANLGILAANIAKAAFHKPNKHLLEVLEQDSTILEKQRRSFASIGGKLQLASYFEEKPYLGKIVKEPCYSRVKPLLTFQGCTRGLRYHGNRWRSDRQHSREPYGHV